MESQSQWRTRKTFAGSNPKIGNLSFMNLQNSRRLYQNKLIRRQLELATKAKAKASVVVVGGRELESLLTMTKGRQRNNENEDEDEDADERNTQAQRSLGQGLGQKGERAKRQSRAGGTVRRGSQPGPLWRRNESQTEKLCSLGATATATATSTEAQRSRQQWL